jgi:hypothetical protein
VDDVDVGPEADGLAGALRAEPELPAHRPQIPDGGTTRSNSTGPSAAGRRRRTASIARSAVSVAAGVGTQARLAGSQSPSNSRCSSGAGSKRSDGATGARVSSA